MGLNLLEKAVAVAIEAHAGQEDKQGRPYILHPLQLMLQMDTEAEMITAVLHDVIEDTAMTLADLEDMGFPEPVLRAVSLLTHDTASSPYPAYISAIKDNALARRVKLADLAHNMDVLRLPFPLTPRDWGRLEKYRQAWEMLSN